jgi:hypothetical protein
MAIPWRVARSLDVLLGQLNALAPRRNKASDGSIGDADHQNRSSDHNPWYGPGIVTARDFTHDPAGGLNCQTLANTLVGHRDPRIKYIIWSRQIWNPSAGWQRYSGANPHTNHLHLSVVASPACDSTAQWAGIGPLPPSEDEVELTDTIRFDDGREVTVMKTLAEGWQNSYDTLTIVRSLASQVARLESDVAELKATRQAEVDEATLAAELEARGIGGVSAAELIKVLQGIRPTPDR